MTSPIVRSMHGLNYRSLFVSFSLTFLSNAFGILVKRARLNIFDTIDSGVIALQFVRSVTLPFFKWDSWHNRVSVSLLISRFLVKCLQINKRTHLLLFQHLFQQFYQNLTKVKVLLFLGFLNTCLSLALFNVVVSMPHSVVLSPICVEDFIGLRFLANHSILFRN